MANSVFVLHNSLLEVLLTVELIGVLLANLREDVVREPSIFGDLLCLQKQTLLHESVDLDVVFHL